MQQSPHQQQFFSYQLSSGLRVYGHEINDDVAGILILVKAGTLTERKGIYGISHFLEHLMFEGTKKRTAMQISSAIENKGGEINAATGNEYTLYYSKIRRDALPLAIEVLGDMLSNPLFEKKAIEKERAIILSEIAMVYDEPRHYRWVLLENGVFAGTKRAIPAYGVKEDVQRITRQDIEDYYHRYYQARNMIVVLVGKHLQPLLPLLERAFTLSPGSLARIQRKLPSPHSIEAKRPIQQHYLFYGFPAPSRGSKERFVFDVIRAILGKPLSGWIYKELRIKRSIGYEANVYYDPGIFYGLFALSASCQSKHLPLVKKIFLQQWNNLQDVGKKTLQQAKDFLIGERTLFLHDPIHRAEELAFAALAHDFDAYFSYASFLSHITGEEIARFAKKTKGVWVLLSPS